MKTAEEFVSKWSNWWITNNNKNVLNRAFENELKEIIEQAQKEAMRWRTFDEKPIIHSWILVRPKLYPIFKPKVKRVDVFIDLSKKYTHWRPIE